MSPTERINPESLYNVKTVAEVQQLLGSGNSVVCTFETSHRDCCIQFLHA